MMDFQAESAFSAASIHVIWIYLIVDFDHPELLNKVQPDYTLYLVFDVC